MLWYPHQLFLPIAGSRGDGAGNGGINKSDKWVHFNKGVFMSLPPF